MIAGNGGVAIDDNSVAFTGDIDTIGSGRAGNSVFALEGYCRGFGIAFGVGNGDVGGFAGGDGTSFEADRRTVRQSQTSHTASLDSGICNRCLRAVCYAKTVIFVVVQDTFGYCNGSILTDTDTVMTIIGNCTSAYICMRTVE